jgi:Tol biopolymer transport system component
VVFQSNERLDPLDTDTSMDIYFRDLDTSTTTLVSVRTDGTAITANAGGPQISRDGELVIFSGDLVEYGLDPAGLIPNILVRDLEAGSTEGLPFNEVEYELYSPKNPRLSGSARFVTFVARLLNGELDNVLFIYDRDTQALEIAGQSSAGEPANTSPPGSGIFLSAGEVSDDGRFVAFASGATNLTESDNNLCIDVFLRDRVNETTIRVNAASSGFESSYHGGAPSISGDASTIIFSTSARDIVPNDTNGLRDVFAVATEDLAEPVPFAEPQAHCGIRPGDTDCDGTLTAADVIGVLMFLAQMTGLPECTHLANTVNCFGPYRPVDALSVLKVASVGGFFSGTCGK